jgi:hypothetical protein
MFHWWSPWKCSSKPKFYQFARAGSLGLCMPYLPISVLCLHFGVLRCNLVWHRKMVQYIRLQQAFLSGGSGTFSLSPTARQQCWWVKASVAPRVCLSPGYRLGISCPWYTPYPLRPFPRAPGTVRLPTTPLGALPCGVAPDSAGPLFV